MYQEKSLSFAPLFPVIFTAVVLFLAVNGPSNWFTLWDQLVNPPADARHAIRKGNPLQKTAGATHLQRIQLQEYANGVQKALETNTRDEKSRLALVKKVYTGLELGEEVTKQVS